ncbi:MAG TPA: hypothetical protein VK612_07960 [Pyrinomonadaceae bacterium]|nr:hypothetical protein [Pyrinomonadaceae bacterium]
MSDRKYIVLAHIIKFGIPLGVVLVAAKVIYAIILGKSGVDIDVIGISFLTLVLCICFGAILGLFKSRAV